MEYVSSDETLVSDRVDDFLTLQLEQRSVRSDRLQAEGLPASLRERAQADVQRRRISSRSVRALERELTAIGNRFLPKNIEDDRVASGYAMAKALAERDDVRLEERSLACLLDVIVAPPALRGRTPRSCPVPDIGCAGAGKGNHPTHRPRAPPVHRSRRLDLQRKPPAPARPLPPSRSPSPARSASRTVQRSPRAARSTAPRSGSADSRTSSMPAISYSSSTSSR